MANNYVPGARIRRVWTPSESKALLEIYSVRKGELIHKRKKRLGYANMLKDLKSLGVLTSPTDVDMVEVRIKSMIRAYRLALHQEEITGKRCKIALWDEMEATFGELSSTASTTVSFSRGKPSAALFLPSEFGESSFRFDDEPQAPPKPSISQIFFKAFLERNRSTEIQVKKEAKRNEQLQQRLKIREDFEDRREMAREKRFQQILAFVKLDHRIESKQIEV